MDESKQASRTEKAICDGQYRIVLADDVFPVKTGMTGSSWLFKYANADAYVYVFMPVGIAASSLLDLNRAKGYHNAAIELKDNVLTMAYMNDGNGDGYIRYVEIKKEYVARKMSIFALILKDANQHESLSREYESVLKTITPISSN